MNGFVLVIPPSINCVPTAHRFDNFAVFAGVNVKAIAEVWVCGLACR